MLVTQAEFSRLAGVSRSAVKQAINNGLITAVLEQNGKVLINKNEGLAQYKANSRRQRATKQSKPDATVQSAPGVANSEGLEMLSWGQAATPTPARSKPVAVPSPPPTTAAAAVAAAVLALPDDSIPGRDISEERKLHYQAELAKVQALQAREEVGSVDAMKREAFALGKAVRDGVLSVVPRVSADLAALADSFEIEQRLEAELLTALRVLADG